MRTLTKARALLFACSVALVIAGCAGGPANSPGGNGTGATGSGEWTPQFDKGVLQPLPDGFPRQPLTIAVQGQAGSDDGIYARQFQQAARAISPVPLRVVDRPDLGTQWDLLRWVGEQPGGTDGRILQVATVPGATIDLLTSPIAAEWGMSVESLDFLQLTEHVPWVMIGRTNAPWGNSVEQMVAWAKANPGKLKFVARGPDSGTTLAFHDFAKQLGFEFDETIGGSAEEIAVIIGAGKGDVAMTLPGVSAPFVQDGRVVLMSCTGTANPCNGAAERVPNMASVTGTADPWGANRGLVVNENVPPQHREWLATLVREVTKAQEFRDARARLTGLTMTEGDKEDAVRIQQRAYDVAKVILKDLGVLHPTVK
jgi:tripartite-type tricarboxylate transporter receptor subunit TctC